MYEAEAGHVRVHQDQKLQGGQKVGEKNLEISRFFFQGHKFTFLWIIATKSKCNKDSLGRNESSVSGVQSSNFEATRPTSMRPRPRPDATRPRPDTTRPRPNNLASRP